MRSERWEPDKTFKEISVNLLNPSALSRVEEGRWFHKDAIHNLEARVPTKACDQLGNVQSHSSAGTLQSWYLLADLQDGGASNNEVKEVSGRDGHTPKLEV